MGTGAVECLSWVFWIILTMSWWRCIMYWNVHLEDERLFPCSFHYSLWFYSCFHDISLSSQTFSQGRATELVPLISVPEEVTICPALCQPATGGSLPRLQCHLGAVWWGHDQYVYCGPGDLHPPWTLLSCTAAGWHTQDCGQVQCPH